MEQYNNPVIHPMENPLDNHLVLKQIFGFLESSATINDWKNFRLVCKLWHNETLSIWRATACLNLVGTDGTCKIQSKFKGATLSEFLTEQQNTSSITQLNEKPFQNHKLQNFTIDLIDCDTANSIHSFITSVGQLIKSLSLVHVNFKTESKSKSAVMTFFIEKTPNLKHLSMNHIRMNGLKVERFPDNNVQQVHSNVKTISYTKFWGLPFTKFSNLEDVTLNGFSRHNVIDLLPRRMHLSHQLPFINPSVKRLDLMNFSNECGRVTLNRFQELRFSSLEHLLIDANFIGFIPNSYALLPILLNNHSDILKVLEVFTSISCENTRCPIDVQLPVLTELRVWGNVFTDFSFLRFTPNLKKLHMDLYGFEKKEKMRYVVEDGAHCGVRMPITSDMIKLTQNLTGIVLEKLEYFQFNFKLPIASLLSLGKWMPNLTTLKTVIDSSTFPIVCRQWPRLERLECLFGSSVTDESITGPRGFRSCGRALIDLKDLKSFHYHAACDKSLLSDVIVNEGFLLIPQFTEVNICVSSEFSKEAEAVLTQRIKNANICRNYASNSLHENWQCCKDTAYKSYVFSSQSKWKRENVNVENSDSSDSEIEEWIDLLC